MIIHLSKILSEIQNRLICKEQIYDSKILSRWAAVHLVLHYSDCWRIAMIKRVLNPADPWSGHYAFPGGKVESDESHKQAALRETCEEINLLVSEDSYLGAFYSFQLKVEGKPIDFAISSHLSVLSGDLPELAPQPSEVDQAYWFTMKELLNPHHRVHEKFEVFSGNIFRPCIKFDGHTIWGISYYILRELVEQLDGIVMEDGLVMDASLIPKD